jgi:hypothetical protein
MFNLVGLHINTVRKAKVVIDLSKPVELWLGQVYPLPDQESAFGTFDKLERVTRYALLFHII